MFPWSGRIGFVLLGFLAAGFCAGVAGAEPVPVEFRFLHPTAAEVNLAGTFNEWCHPGGGGIDTGIDPMIGPDAGGRWTLEKLLDAGDYEYKFVANGHEWFTDPLNPRIDYYEYNNSMLAVSDPLVYYLLPNAVTGYQGPLPLISADLAKSAGAAFDLAELRVYLDGDLVAAGSELFDPLTGRATYAAAESLSEGTHTAVVSIALAGGAADADTSTFEVIADSSPPQIVHTPPVTVVAHALVHITATITDDRGVESAACFYRNSGDAEYQIAAMQVGLEDQWIATVPAGFTEAGGSLEYVLHAQDLLNVARAPESDVYAVAVSDDEQAPVVSEAFTSPGTLIPNGDDDETRLSFFLSEPAEVGVTVQSATGTPVRTLLSAAGLDAGYHQLIWDGRNGSGALVSGGAYEFEITALDAAGIPAAPATAPVTVAWGVPAAPIKVVLLFHANQTLNYQGDTANDVCFWGLLDVLRRHPDSKFAIHFSGTLLHDLGWFNFRHDPSSLELLQAGHADAQFEIIGSTYSQNIPYSTNMWDNARQIEVHREVIEKLIGATPTSFWNAERCWKQALVPLLSQEGYRATWVESHILWDSGTSLPEYAVRKTRLGESDLVVFNDDAEMIWLLDSAIDSGNSADLIGYLDWLRGQDTYRDWVVCYAQDAEATGLWDYEGGSNPQEDWTNLDQVLTDLEATGWIELTTFRDYLAERHPIEELSPIVDGQANWMVGPSQAAGYADWFDYNERSPLLATYRGFYDDLRSRIQAVAAQVTPGTPAGRLVEHAIWNLVAHQFEFGCIGCGSMGCQDWQKAETLVGALQAAEACLAPPATPQIAHRDANGDGLSDWILTTANDFYIIGETGGRLLRWFDLEYGEEILGNEFFMWGYYYWGWRDWYSGSGHNDDVHYMEDALWDAPHHYPAAQPFSRAYATRKHAFNDWLAVDGGDDRILLDLSYDATVAGDTLHFVHYGSGFTIDKGWAATDSSLAVVYRLTNTSLLSHDYELRVENALHPGLLDVMNHGRGSLMYWDGADSSSQSGAQTIGVVNVVTGRGVTFDFSEAPATLAGGETVHGLIYAPAFAFTLAPGETRRLTITVACGPTGLAADEDSSHAEPRLRLQPVWPNPFQERTQIAFELPAAGAIDLSIYDILGRRIRTLRSGRWPAARYRLEWDGTRDDGSMVGAGLYFCRLRVGSEDRVRRLLFLR